jgi:hypothetical protein
VTGNLKFLAKFLASKRCPDATALLVEYTPTILVLENTTVINLKNAPCLAIISERKNSREKYPLPIR